MRDIFKSIVQTYIDANRQIVVAYSGGLDSTVLLHLAKSLTDNLVAIHVNHNLSPNAQAWQSHCKTLCEQWHIRFVAKSVVLKGDGSGIEAEARKRRYAAIAQSIEPDAVVLTGQHQDDQLETFLLQLKRGAGPKGLSSMPSVAPFVKQALLVRPLLYVSRDSLEHYAKQQGLQWIEDESNTDTRFDRNFIRHQVLPNLNLRWSGFTKAASRSIALIGEQQQLVDELAAQDLLPLQKAHNELCIFGLLQLSEPRQRNVLRHWIDTLAIAMPSQVILGRILTEVIDAKIDANPKVQWAGHQIRRFRATLYLLPDNIERPGIDWELTLNRPVILNDRIGIALLSDDPYTPGLSVPAPQADEKVYLRFGVPGLSIKPQGSNHTRKLKDLFKQQGIPPWQRARVPLLFYNEQLIAVGDLAIASNSASRLIFCFKAL